MPLRARIAETELRTRLDDVIKRVNLPLRRKEPAPNGLKIDLAKEPEPGSAMRMTPRGFENIFTSIA